MTGQLGGNGDERLVQGPRLDSSRPEYMQGGGVNFAICFDFPENDDPVFAGFAGDALGFAPTLRTAVKFDRETDAERTLQNGYGPSTRPYGVVVEVCE